MPKNIVICCDGTGNQFGTELAKTKHGRHYENNNSNVVRLYTCLKVDKDQAVYYHPGVGTMGSPTSRNRVERWWSKAKGLGFGLGFTDNMADAYRFLMQNYAEGDHIYLFGFSRGAYTVRALAGALNMYGLLCPGNEGHLSYLLGMYADASKKAAKKDRTVPRRLPVTDEATAFRQTFSRTVPIHFMGVWDSVSSIGWVWDPVKLLHDGQNPIVRKARHAISIDERRCFFQAIPWGAPMNLDDTNMHHEDREKLELALENTGWRKQDILQVWFPGVHSDVGGSYPLDESGPALEAFKWMLNEARPAEPQEEGKPLVDGLIISPVKEAAVFGRHLQHEAAHMPHAETLPAATEQIGAVRALTPKPTVNQNVTGIVLWNNPQPRINTKFHDSLCGPWWILEAFPHKYFDYAGDKHWRITPWPHAREIPVNAIMHPEVKRRLELSEQKDCPPENIYSPRNLKLGQLKPLDYKATHTLHPEVRDRIIEQNYSRFDRHETPNSSEKELPKVVAAACVLVGAAAFFFARYT